MANYSLHHIPRALREEARQEHWCYCSTHPAHFGVPVHPASFFDVHLCCIYTPRLQTHQSQNKVTHAHCTTNKKNSISTVLAQPQENKRTENGFCTFPDFIGINKTKEQGQELQEIACENSVLFPISDKQPEN